jgi:hypothetical protein
MPIGGYRKALAHRSKSADGAGLCQGSHRQGVGSQAKGATLPPLTDSVSCATGPATAESPWPPVGLTAARPWPSPTP